MKTNLFFDSQGKRVTDIMATIDMQSFPVSYDWDFWTGARNKNLFGDYPRNVGCIIATHKNPNCTAHGVQLTNGMYVVEAFHFEDRKRVVMPVPDKEAFLRFFSDHEIDWTLFDN